MNTTRVPQPPTYIPPPQHFIPAMPMPPMTTPEKEKGKKINTAFFATVAFFVLSHPIAYRVINHVFTAFSGNVHEIITETGAPTMKGHFLHSVVFFFVILLLLMKK